MTQAIVFPIQGPNESTALRFSNILPFTPGLQLVSLLLAFQLRSGMHFLCLRCVKPPLILPCLSLLP